MMRRTCLILIVFVAVGAGVSLAGKPKTTAWYDDETDTFVSKGSVPVDVSVARLGQVAGDFRNYRKWSLKGINEKPRGGKYNVLIRDVFFRPGGSAGLGAFDLIYDVDLIWPFGSKDNMASFDVVKVNKRADGGIDRMVCKLSKKNNLLDRFDIDLRAEGSEAESRVVYRNDVKFIALINAFFSLKQYRKNIEGRVIKVLENLKLEVSQK